MTSLRQIAANCGNAQLSTGPRTKEGRAVAALNAVGQGLLSQHILIRGEEEADLAAFAARLRNNFAPAGELQHLLVEGRVEVE